MKIGLAQINTIVGDLPGNARKILDAYRQLVACGAQLVVTPELSLTGYPPLDLLFKSRFVPRNLEVLAALQADIGSVPLLVGYVDFNEGTGQPFRNAAALLRQGHCVHRVFKSLLPTYDVFDEERYFEPAEGSHPVEIAGVCCGITICEDIWTEKYLPRRLYGTSPIDGLIAQGARVLINLSASPFTIGKPQLRADMLASVARQHQVPIVYCNAVGGNDQLVFDGYSLVLGPDGGLRARLAGFTEACTVVDTDQPTVLMPSCDSVHADMADLHGALCLGLRDYLHKCGFRSAVLGLSGGIDSAIVACLAAHALGPENVLGVTMPSQYSSSGSVDDSQRLAENLGIRFLSIPIQPAFETVKAQFTQLFAGLPENETEENLQPRLRGLTLMALSNKFGHLLLSTGNKSELAVGYCTLYGDMCGGLSVISDVPKTTIYRLAAYINREREIIPYATIEKPPSAELKPDQRDQDTLPPYEILDGILERYVEDQLGVAEIVADGFDEATVRWVQRRVDLNEYKRAQAVPGLKVSDRAFGIGRKMPVAQRFAE